MFRLSFFSLLLLLLLLIFASSFSEYRISSSLQLHPVIEFDAGIVDKLIKATFNGYDCLNILIHDNINLMTRQLIQLKRFTLLVVLRILYRLV